MKGCFFLSLSFSPSLFLSLPLSLFLFLSSPTLLLHITTSTVYIISPHLPLSAPLTQFTFLIALPSPFPFLSSLSLASEETVRARALPPSAVRV